MVQGRGGGFGTSVDLEKIGDLIYVFCNALSKADFHYQLAVTKDAFNYMARGMFKIATQPGAAFNEGFQKIGLWWEDRKATKTEAQNLAKYLISHRSITINRKKIPLEILPPETIGPMLHLLTESFVESWAEEQEKAVVLLLSHLRSWRHFIAALECCSKDGSKVNAMDSLDRLNSLLDGMEQQQFNRFIGTLAINIDTTAPDFGMLAWNPGLPWRKERTLIAAKRSNHFDGLA